LRREALRNRRADRLRAEIDLCLRLMGADDVRIILRVARTLTPAPSGGGRERRVGLAA
jgi:hypothetical protein